MSEALQQEIRHLRTLEGSVRDPRDRIFLPLADAHFRHGRPDTAADMLREGLTRHPDFVAAHVLMGRVLAALGEHDEAEETWAAARRLDPGNAEALLALGRVMVSRGETVGGDLVLRALAIDPTAGGQEPDADVVSIAELAPKTTIEPEVMPVAELAPEDHGVVSIADLAPDRSDSDSATPGVTASGDASADEPGAHDEVTSGVSGGTARETPSGGGRRVVTRTLAELLAAQGQRTRAIEMYEELVARAPHDPVLQDRLRALRDSMDTVVDEDEVDHRLSRPEPAPEAPTPFAWTEESHAAEEAPHGDDGTASTSGGSDEGGTAIADYLAGLLSRSPSSPSGDASGS